ncbi:hypothetical protein JCGZ_25457 [Jatropha curcas]|uniref:Uncharacterized protein n=1 Tax=Jatropha curcas TaxID=180498 RepID=A0A067L4L9_JATCU|nr:hypothetical protein JCGZ_25457 [Jatropha curcas]
MPFATDMSVAKVRALNEPSPFPFFFFLSSPSPLLSSISSAAPAPPENAPAPVTPPTTLRSLLYAVRHRLDSI